MSGLQKVSSGEFKSVVEESVEPVLIDFYATWCGPCRLISPILEELSTAYVGKVKFVKIDIDDAPDIAGRFAVSSVPTLLMVKGGQEADRKVGALPKPMLQSWIDNALA